VVQLPPHEVGGGARISDYSSPPVQEECEMHTTSPVTGSVNGSCVITLLRVVVDVTVALCAIGGAAAGSTGAGSASPGGAEERGSDVRVRRTEEALQPSCV
jgi:hypothetical protein